MFTRNFITFIKVEIIIYIYGNVNSSLFNLSELCSYNFKIIPKIVKTYFIINTW